MEANAIEIMRHAAILDHLGEMGREAAYGCRSSRCQGDGGEKQFGEKDALHRFDFTDLNARPELLACCKKMPRRSRRTGAVKEETAGHKKPSALSIRDRSATEPQSKLESA